MKIVYWGVHQREIPTKYINYPHDMCYHFGNYNDIERIL
jgi:hypothetical protein